MLNYNGNAICDYVVSKGLNYFFSARNSWMLVYGDSNSIPKLLVYVRQVGDYNETSLNEKKHEDMVQEFARTLKLPFIYVRFKLNCSIVMVREPWEKRCKSISYDELRDIFEKYDVVSPGTPKKAVNQYTSSSYHVWQRETLGAITVSDFDLLRIKNHQIEEIIELKRSKYDIEKWTPFTNDYPNFALLINSIVNSGKRIPFTLYYNKMADGPEGGRVEDISRIKVFSFDIPDRMINRNQVKFEYKGIFRPDRV